VTFPPRGGLVGGTVAANKTSIKKGKYIGALVMNRVSPGGGANLAAKNLKSEGNKAYQSGDWAGAVQKYTEALSTSPDAASKGLLLSIRAEARLQLGEFADAVSDCREALALDPGDRKTRGRLARAKQGLGSAGALLSAGGEKSRDDRVKFNDGGSTGSALAFCTDTAGAKEVEIREVTEQTQVISADIEMYDTTEKKMTVGTASGQPVGDDVHRWAPGSSKPGSSSPGPEAVPVGLEVGAEVERINEEMGVVRERLERVEAVVFADESEGDGEGEVYPYQDEKANTESWRVPVDEGDEVAEDAWAGYHGGVEAWAGDNEFAEQAEGEDDREDEEGSGDGWWESGW
jgi:hypothetical protein